MTGIPPPPRNLFVLCHITAVDVLFLGLFVDHHSVNLVILRAIQALFFMRLQGRGSSTRAETRPSATPNGERGLASILVLLIINHRLPSVEVADHSTAVKARFTGAYLRTVLRDLLQGCTRDVVAGHPPIHSSALRVVSRTS